MHIFSTLPDELPVAVLDILPDPVLIKGADLRYVWVNAAFEKLFGVSRTDLRGQLDKDFFKSRQVAQCSGGDLRVLETGAVDEAYETVFDQQGSARETITRKSRLVLSDGAVFLVGVMHDVTEVVHANRQLEEKQEMLIAACARAEDASQAKSRFLAGVSHELRTPLNAILGFAQVLNGGIGAVEPERSAEYGGIILQSGERLLRLINEVLDLSQFDSAESSFAIGEFDAARVSRQVTAELAHIGANFGVAVIDTTHEGPDLRLVADPDRTTQVLLNLVANAIKYNRPGGKATISASLKDNFVRFSVVDTGIGIDAGRQGQVFEIFNRLGNEHSDIEGTGIGLSLAKDYVEKMNGRIGFESVSGIGSTFWFELPAAQVANENTEDARVTLCA